MKTNQPSIKDTFVVRRIITGTRRIVVPVFLSVCFNASAETLSCEQHFNPHKFFTAEGVYDVVAPGATKEFFGKYPQVYDAALKRFPPHRDVRNWHVEAHAQMNKSGGVYFDLGGGTGLIIEDIVADDLSRVGQIFDLSEEMTEYAAQKELIDPQNIFLGDVRDLKRNGVRVPDNSVDGAVSNNMTYMMSEEDILKMLKELFRVLKPGSLFTWSSMGEGSDELFAQFGQRNFTVFTAYEKEGYLPEGATQTIFEANQRIVNAKPTKLSKEDIYRLASQAGFEVLSHHQNGYDGVLFFAELLKPE